MVYIFYPFAILLIFLGFKSLRGGFNYLNYFRRELTRTPSGFAPFATIFVPCRGIDQDLNVNLGAIVQQEYPDYEVVFVVDREDDKAVKVIRQIMSSADRNRESSVKISFVIAGNSVNEGQKVHNLRMAVPEASVESEVFVFADSDARPGPNWLSQLVAPLADDGIGCATGYRWFIPLNGGLAGHLRSVWNASIASALGPNQKTNFCWGGSMAMRRKLFEQLDIRSVWQGTLSDDFAVTRCLKEADLPIVFVPGCLTATVEDCGFREFMEFSTRQMKITRVYAADLWMASLIGSFLFSAIVLFGICLLFFAEGWNFWLTFLSLSIIYALGAAKAAVRLKAVGLVLRNYDGALRKSRIWHLTLWVISPAVYFYNNLCALVSNEITWRGITYKLQSPRETIVLPEKES